MPAPEDKSPGADLEPFLKAVNEAAARVRGLWLGYIALLAYLFISVGAVTHRDLFLENPVTLPVLNVELPLTGFFAVAPVFFLINHFYLLLMLSGLGRRIAEFNGQLERSGLNENARRRERRRLDNFVIVQMLGGTKEEREGLTGVFLRAIAVITLVIAPLLLLFAIQISFLPYHFQGITWLHRGAILTDLALLWLFWPAIRSGAWTWPRRPQAICFGAATGLLVGFSVLVATFPGEVADRSGFGGMKEPGSARASWQTPTDWVLWPLKKLLFEGNINSVSGQRDSLFSRTITLPDQDFVDDERLKKISERAKSEGKKPSSAERTIRLRGRDLRGAVLARVDLRHADLTGAYLEGADLGSAELQGAKLNSAKLHKSYLLSAKLAEASLVDAELRRALLDDADLQGADFTGASLEFAAISSARLEGANFQHTFMPGAVFTWSDLRGANFEDAELQAASFENVNLQGAGFLRADMPGAILQSAKLQGASFRYADLSDAHFEDTNVVGATFESALVWHSRPPGKNSSLFLADFRVGEIKAPSEDSLRPLRELVDQFSSIRLRLTLQLLLDPGSISSSRRSKNFYPEWVRLKMQSEPPPAALSKYLVNIACGDDGPIAKGIARRALNRTDSFRGISFPYTYNGNLKLLARGLTKKTCSGARKLDNDQVAELCELANWTFTDSEEERSQSVCPH